jgi:hypothetical protein
LQVEAKVEVTELKRKLAQLTTSVQKELEAMRSDREAAEANVRAVELEAADCHRKLEESREEVVAAATEARRGKRLVQALVESRAVAAVAAATASALASAADSAASAALLVQGDGSGGSGRHIYSAGELDRRLVQQRREAVEAEAATVALRLQEAEAQWKEREQERVLVMESAVRGSMRESMERRTIERVAEAVRRARAEAQQEVQQEVQAERKKFVDQVREEEAAAKRKAEQEREEAQAKDAGKAAAAVAAAAAAEELAAERETWEMQRAEWEHEQELLTLELNSERERAAREEEQASVAAAKLATLEDETAERRSVFAQKELALEARLVATSGSFKERLEKAQTLAKEKEENIMRLTARLAAIEEEKTRLVEVYSEGAKVAASAAVEAATSAMKREAETVLEAAKKEAAMVARREAEGEAQAREEALRQLVEETEKAKREVGQEAERERQQAREEAWEEAREEAQQQAASVELANVAEHEGVRRERKAHVEHVADMHEALLEIEAEHQRNTPRKGGRNDEIEESPQSEVAKATSEVFERWC